MMGLSATMKWFESLTESIEDIEAAERTRAVYVSYTPLGRFLRRVMHTFRHGEQRHGAVTGKRYRHCIELPATPPYLCLNRHSVNASIPYRNFYFKYGLQAHPIYTKSGDFPTLFKERVANKSRDQGFVRSRLPAFTIEEVEYIRQSHDFFGVNYYTTLSVQHKVNHSSMFSMQSDLDVEITENLAVPGTEIDWLKNYPVGLRKALNYVREHYENPLILITENGCGMKTTTLNDDQCVEYLQVS